MQSSPRKGGLAKKGLTEKDSCPQTPLAFLGKCPFKDYFYGISALLYCSQCRETKRWETRGMTCSKGPEQDLNPSCYYCTSPALWATGLPRHSKRDLLIQLLPCFLQRLCTSQRGWKAEKFGGQAEFLPAKMNSCYNFRTQRRKTLQCF